MSTSWLERLRTQLGDFDALAPSEPAACETRPAPEKWCPREHLAHLARYHEVTLERVGRILEEDRPALGRYRAEDDPRWPVWKDRPLGEVRGELVRLREALVARLEALDPAAWERVGMHPRLGALTLRQWIEFFLVHEGHHLYVVVTTVARRPAGA